MSSSFWFWSHFALVTLSHFFVLTMIWYMFVYFRRSSAPVVDKLFKVAVIFFISVFGINHITSSKSECYLTTLESRALVKEGKAPVDDFLPRYYATIRKVFP